MFNPDPAHYLPHRYPFLFLDRITTLVQGAQAVAVTGVTGNHGFPQIFMIESVAQLAGIVVAQAEVEGGFIAAIDHAEFSAPAVAGDILTISAKVIKSFGRLFIIEGNVTSGAGQLLSVQLTLGVGKL
ncbi:MAG: hydroxymyristoyl-ACP dehydratase [Geobacteraceae bacterium]|nr:hydroxymyristoyl-ACP dehydratase [Geobacteraceae bacterium]NTW80299.1 hydroxymyristoyl-ACP dehydratase [Geobacteraceae bacterium]